MKDWWLNLALREKQMVAAGSLVIILFLLYEIIWSPLVLMNDNLRIRIQHNRDTLTSMQNTNQLIQHIEKTSQEKRQKPKESLLGILQTEINKSIFASHVMQLHQAESDAVQFNLTKVDFDKALVFLTSLWKTYNIIVSQMTVTPTGTPGEVMMDVTVKAAQ